jgi:photosystem II stability/assembly factor-like uncharacterized protein
MAYATVYAPSRASSGRFRPSRWCLGLRCRSQPVMVRTLCFGTLFFSCVAVRPPALPTSAQWQQTAAATYKGKQDDIFFVDAERGFYANGAGDVFRTSDHGEHWEKVLSKPGTYWRAMGFLDAQHGFLGNIGTDAFPGVTDETPLYRTSDGAKTVEPVPLSAPVKGLCAIDVLRSKFIDAGELRERIVLHAAGRVGGPAWLLRSLDAGATWRVIDLNSKLAMITDVKFLSESVGYVVGGTNSAVEQSNAVILKTVDGGASWKVVYQSTRPLEIIWKIAWPTSEVGYATVMHYDPNRAPQFVAKTTDSGNSWFEVPLTNDAKAREFGVTFLDAQTGWVGTGSGGFQTTDGGKTWSRVEFGRTVNKLRVVPDETGRTVWAIGADVYRLRL